MARWTFDAIEKGVVKDLSGHGLHAVSHGAKLADGKHGQALLGDDQGKTMYDHFFGRIDDLEIYDRTLSAAEVAALAR